MIVCVGAAQLRANPVLAPAGLPSPQHVLGLPTASHVLAVDNAMVARAYTPITLDRYEKGYFDLVIKKYKGGEFSERFHK